jgi:anti-anti-sigma factor
VPHAATCWPRSLPLLPSRSPSLATPLRIDTVERGATLVLAVEGEIDITTSQMLDDALRSARDTDAARIVVDLRAVSFIDSTGLHVLIRHTCAEEPDPRIRLTKSSPQAQRLFELSGAAEYLPFLS